MNRNFNVPNIMPIRRCSSVGAQMFQRGVIPHAAGIFQSAHESGKKPMDFGAKRPYHGAVPESGLELVRKPVLRQPDQGEMKVARLRADNKGDQMMRGFLAVLIFLSMAVFGCQGKEAQQLFDTAQLEELQNNREHARSLYEEIVRKYPDSEVAAKARERLSAMRSGS